MTLPKKEKDTDVALSRGYVYRSVQRAFLQLERGPTIQTTRTRKDHSNAKTSSSLDMVIWGRNDILNFDANEVAS